MDILYWKTFQQLQIPVEDLTSCDDPIYGFSRERVPTRGYVDIHTTFGEGRQIKTISVCYLVVDTSTPTTCTGGAHPSTPLE